MVHATTLSLENCWKQFERLAQNALRELKKSEQILFQSMERRAKLARKACAARHKGKTEKAAALLDEIAAMEKSERRLAELMDVGTRELILIRDALAPEASFQ